MSRSSYDDMPDSRMNNRYSGNRGKTGLIAIAGILIALLCILLFLIFTPSSEKEEATIMPESQERAVETAAIEIPEIYIPEPEPQIQLEEKIIEEPEIPAPAAEEEASDASVIADEDINALKWNSYIWKEGDTLNEVSAQFGISPNTIISVNRISNIAAIKKGTELLIPSLDGQLYELKPTDTLSSIASRFNPSLTAKELGDLNGITEESLDNIKEIFIPAPEEEYIVSAFPHFASPIKGNEIILFGEFYNGRRIDGTVFAASSGEAVKASLSGFVVDTGINPIYGKFVTLMHDNGYKTSYYALESVDVKTGENVAKGSVIGSVGDSSIYFGSPALLFTVEQSGIKINPDNVLNR